MNEILNAVGALAELCGLMRDELIKNGFSRKEAVAMTTEYLKTTAIAGHSEPEEE